MVRMQNLPYSQRWKRGAYTSSLLLSAPENRENIQNVFGYANPAANADSQTQSKGGIRLHRRRGNRCAVVVALRHSVASTDVATRTPSTPCRNCTTRDPGINVLVLVSPARRLPHWRRSSPRRTPATLLARAVSPAWARRTHSPFRAFSGHPTNVEQARIGRSTSAEASQAISNFEMSPGTCS